MAGRARAFRAFGGVYGAFGAFVVFVAFVVFRVFAAFVLFLCALLVFGVYRGLGGLGVVLGCLGVGLWGLCCLCGLWLPYGAFVVFGAFRSFVVFGAFGAFSCLMGRWVPSDASGALAVGRLDTMQPGSPARRRAQSREATHERSSEAVPSQFACDYFRLGDGQCCSARACDTGGLKGCRRGVFGGHGLIVRCHW